METKIDLDWLLRVRLVIARCGEMDANQWWHTSGQLGPYGAKVLRRGFPRTHYFAQARSVFAVAAHRCAEVYGPPNSASFWRLTDEVEDAFDAKWETWIDSAETWAPFFESIAAISDFDSRSALRRLLLVNDGDLEDADKLKLSADSKGVHVRGPFDLRRRDVSLLALGFSKSGKGDLRVPFSPLRGP